MNWNPEEFAKQIEVATSRYDGPEVERICDHLTDYVRNSLDPFPLPAAKRILSALRRKRNFKLMQQVADVLIQNGQSEPRVRREYAQSLLDQDNLSAAITFLKDLVTESAEDPNDRGEHLEARGLLGRAYKQVYVNTNNSSDKGARKALNEAITSYLDVYQAEPENLWHGINATALLLRAVADGVQVDGIPDPKATAESIAQDILNTVETKWNQQKASMWDMGTAAEACLALQGSDGAIEWIKRYVAEPQSDAFELAATLRQFTEVWRLDPSSEIGRQLLPLLQGELLKKEGGGLSLRSTDLEGLPSQEDTKRLEKIFGRHRYVNYQFFLHAIERGRAVARIEDSGGVGIGTAFLIRGGDLHPTLGDELLLMTNAHVISDNVSVTQALHPEEAKVSFHFLDATGTSDKGFRIKPPLIWTSPPWELDATLLRLDSAVEGIQPYVLAPRLPAIQEDDEQQVYVIGHPKGGDLSFSIQDNALIDHEGPPTGTPDRHNVVRLHYRAPTEPGSSGSPVFNRTWSLLGIHHAGDRSMRKLNGQPGTYSANEGIWIQSIREAMERELRPID